MVDSCPSGHADLKPRGAGEVASLDFLQLGVTRLESQFLLDVLSGESTAEMARRASLNEATVEECLTSAYEKLGVHDPLELVLLLTHRKSC